MIAKDGDNTTLTKLRLPLLRITIIEIKIIKYFYQIISHENNDAYDQDGDGYSAKTIIILTAMIIVTVVAIVVIKLLRKVSK